jgi:predicted SAM-dependent methyltransferase
MWLVVRGAAWAKRGQRVRVGTAPVKVNLGCGLSVAPGWINVDGGVHAMCAKWPRPLLSLLYRHAECKHTHSRDQYFHLLREARFVHQSLEYGVPFDADTVDFMYSSHMLEHLFREDAAKLLCDAHRALKPGGLIRVAVPDLAYALELYEQGSKEEALGFFFATGQAGWLNQHHYMYDFELLASLMASAGFSEIERRDYRTGACPDISLLDNRPEETLFVEARKSTVHGVSRAQ